MELTVVTNSPNSLTVTTNITEIDINPADIEYHVYGTGSVKYRTGERDDIFVLDKTLTPTGFDGVENTDWENIEESS